MNITLIGMPGSGKTTIGKALARSMKLAFLDSDREIERLHGGTLAEIIARAGQDGFRAIEEDVNAGLQVADTVIAPGGSVVYGARAMAHLREISTVIYLQLSYAHVAERLGDLAARGVTFAPGQTLRDLYLERIPLYEQYAHLTAPCDGKSVGAIVAWIRAQLAEREAQRLQDETLMRQAIALSRQAVTHGNEPFGAVLAKDGKVVFTNENQIHTRHDPTFHGEAGLLRTFCEQTGITDLRDYTLYSSCEPCFMCSGAMVWTQLGRLVYGTSNIELERILGNEGSECSKIVFAHSCWQPRVTSGVLRDEALAVLMAYFGK